MGKKKSLFEDDEPVPVEPVLKVNQDFAKRFEHNEKRAELHRLKEKYPEKAAKLESQLLGISSKPVQGGRGPKPAGKAEREEEAEESSDNEDEDDGYLPPKTEARLLETLLKIRGKDQSIYAPDAKFYSSEEEGEEGEEEGGAGKVAGRGAKEKPVYLKDVLYRQAMEGGASEGSDSGSEGGRGGRRGASEDAGPLTYNQEQQELKKAFLKAFEEEGEEAAEGRDAFGGVLEKRKGRKEVAAKEEEEDDSDGDGDGGASGATEARVQSLLDSYFGAGQELAEGDRFLKEYILSKGWVERDGEGGAGGGYGGIDFEEADQEDEQYLEQAEEYEQRYNFRFEEPGGAEIVTYPRKLEGVVRKEDDRRKRKRAEKAERLKAEESRRQQELKQLKNLKKQEIQQKLSEIQQVAGQAAPGQSMLDRLMAGDFDPEEYDKHMAAAFGDDYYEGAQEEEEDLADAEFEKELAAMAAGEDGEAADGFDALRKKLLASAGAVAGEGDGDDEAGESSEEEEEEEEEEEGEEEDEEGEGQRKGAGKTKEQLAAERAGVQRLLEEYYKLDYEDFVGGVKTRFRYKEVAKDDFGLSVSDVLALTDKDLNQIVGLKNLAPYREDGGRRVRPNYGALNAIRASQAEAQPGPNKRRKQEWWQKKGEGRGEWKGKHGEDFLEREGDGAGGAGEQPRQQEEQEQQQQQGKEKRKKTRDRGEQPVAEAKPKSEAERRLESFAKPSLKKRDREHGQQHGGGGQQGAGGGKKKREHEQGAGRQQQQGGGGGGKRPKGEQPAAQQAQQAQHDGTGLTKAQKRNLRRAQKRAEKRAADGAS